MKIEFQNISEQSEHLLFIKVMSNDNKLVFRLPFYSNDELNNKCPGLTASLNDIQHVLQMVYESGKKKEMIEFVIKNEEL